MFVHLLVGQEQHPVYQTLTADNLGRQYSFLRSITLASNQLQMPVLSIEVLKALNFHAIACLHPSAGEFRPCQVEIGDHEPPPHFEVPARMQMFTNFVNRMWNETDEIYLAAYVLWQMNWIHPFINGNGRTARAACHLVVCLKSGGWLPGDPILAELIRKNREEYLAHLKTADAAYKTGAIDVTGLHGLLSRLLQEQMNSVAPASSIPP